jgi:hypothetical protein
MDGRYFKIKAEWARCRTGVEQALVVPVIRSLGFLPSKEEMIEVQMPDGSTWTIWVCASRGEFVTIDKFELSTAMNGEGEEVPAFGFSHNDMFIVNARVSECGRFHADPSVYGLTSAEADLLAQLNAGRDLMAYWDL